MRLLLALSIGYANAAGSCQVCQATKDYKGDFIGTGDEKLYLLISYFWRSSEINLNLNMISPDSLVE